MNIHLYVFYIINSPFPAFLGAAWCSPTWFFHSQDPSGRNELHRTSWWWILQMWRPSKLKRTDSRDTLALLLSASTQWWSSDGGRYSDWPRKSWGTSSFPSKHVTPQERSGPLGLLHLRQNQQLTSKNKNKEKTSKTSDMSANVWQSPPVVLHHVQVGLQGRQEELQHFRVRQQLGRSSSNGSQPVEEVLVW